MEAQWEQHLAALYARGGRLYVQPACESRAGSAISGAGVYLADEPVSNALLGTLIELALSRHRAGELSPTPGNAAAKPNALLGAGQVKSWAAFARAASYCAVAEEAGALRLIPSRKVRSRGIYVLLGYRQIKLSLPATSAQIGAAAREALSRCDDVSR